MQLFKVRRLTCFSILDTFTDSSEKEDFLKLAQQFDNKIKEVEEEDKEISIHSFRYAQEQMFKPCVIKRWNVIKKVVDKPKPTV